MLDARVSTDHAAGSRGAICFQHDCLAQALQHLLAALTPLSILQPLLCKKQLLQSLAAVNPIWQL